VALCLAVAGCDSSSDDGPTPAAEGTPGAGGAAGNGLGASGSSGSGGEAGPGGGAGSAGSAGAGGAAQPPKAQVDLRADTNRDGKVDLEDPADDTDEDTWDKAHGAIFLANIDDDQKSCPITGTDYDLAACNDAADEVVNGPDDLLDLARLRAKPWAEAPDDATGTIALSEAAAGKVRLFRSDAEGNFTKFDPAADTLSVDELRAGVELALEGLDILRDDSWDGFVDVTLTVKGGEAAAFEAASDVVRLRLAPVMTRHHLDPAEKIYVAKLSGTESTSMRADLKAAATAAGVPGGVDELSSSKVSGDQWTQDYFETAYTSMPAEGGQHVMHVFYRSANVFSSSKTAPLRPAGRVVFTYFRGPDKAGVQQFDVKHEGDMDSLNSFGNTETIPPYTLGDKSYPLGRLLRGSVPSFHPDKTFAAMLEAQKVQPPVYINTSWLLVGHVDETVSFIKVDSPRGWALVVNDAAMAKKMLEDAQAAGHGGEKLFVGKKWLDDNGKEYSAEATIDAVLMDADVMKTSQEAIAEVDAQLDIIKSETGLTDDEIIHIPYLHMSIQGYSIAYQPGTVNGIYLSDKIFGAPAPHGPVIDGQDIFKAQMEGAFSERGVEVKWIEDWDLYHRLSGEVHCGTNTVRKVPDTEKWWESGYLEGNDR
jgi:protein-arginine deiminase